MPALFTHYKLGQDVLNNTKKEIKDEIQSNIKYYNMFNQGWDNLYYHFPKWDYYKHVGYMSHDQKVKLFFKNAIKYIKDNKLENNSKYTNLLYGIINHYVMDTIIHPYINYQVKSLKINHTKIEYMLDNWIREDKNNKIYKTIIPKIKFDKEYITYINYIYKNTYNLDNMGKVWNRSHNNGYILYRYFINDRIGIKTFLYRIVDLFNPSKFKFHENTFRINMFDKRLLNIDKKEWNHPKNKSEKYNYSYEELYNYSLKICIKLNNIIYNIFHNNKNVNYLLNYIDKININNIQELLH
jgi:hypothetical protein